MGYLTNFMVYVFAMLGVLMLALLVFKYTTGCKTGKSSGAKGLIVTDTLSLGARKTLYIVETNGERFLIAGDTDRTTLISKLNSEFDIGVCESDRKLKHTEGMTYGIHGSQKTPYLNENGIKNIASKLTGVLNK